MELYTNANPVSIVVSLGIVCWLLPMLLGFCVGYVLHALKRRKQ